MAGFCTAACLPVWVCVLSLRVHSLSDQKVRLRDIWVACVSVNCRPPCLIYDQLHYCCRQSFSNIVKTLLIQQHIPLYIHLLLTLNHNFLLLPQQLHGNYCTAWSNCMCMGIWQISCNKVAEKETRYIWSLIKNFKDCAYKKQKWYLIQIWLPHTSK